MKCCFKLVDRIPATLEKKKKLPPGCLTMAAIAAIAHAGMEKMMVQIIPIFSEMLLSIRVL